MVGPITLADGTEGRAVLIGPRTAPEGAMVVLLGKDRSSVESLPFSAVLDRVSPSVVVDVLCAQERQFGDSGLPALDIQ